MAVTVLAIEYLAVPQIVKARSDLSLVDAAPGLIVLALALEIGSLVSYTSLTRVVLRQQFRPRFADQFRIDLTGLGASHVIPGGGAAAAALRFRLMTNWGIPPAEAASTAAVETALAVIGLIATFAGGAILIGPGIVQDPLYAAAGLGAVVALAGVALGVRSASRRPEHHRAQHPWPASPSPRLPFVGTRASTWLAGLANKALRTAQTTTQRAGVLIRTPRQRVAIFGWAGGNWLLDAASLWVCLWAYGLTLHPGALLTAYGAANLMGLLPVTPGGLGIVEGVLIPALIALGDASAAPVALGVLTWRLLEFWLPIPIAGLTYLSLRIQRSDL